MSTRNFTVIDEEFAADDKEDDDRDQDVREIGVDDTVGLRLQFIRASL